MRREAKRTLLSLTTMYQRDIRAEDYEVVAVDNGSTEPIDPDSFNGESNFRYVYFTSGGPSPCRAINTAVARSKAEYVMICIDGARILSPGILKYTLSALSLSGHPFVYTLGMHIGRKPQNYLIEEGYNQDVEDRMFQEIDWPDDGYSLFRISSVALSSKNGFFSRLTESNCFALKRSDFLGLGGLDERFCAPGGGLVNLDFFKTVHEDIRFHPIMLLGEATFHQFHGGVATNVPIDEHPYEIMAREYLRVRGKPYEPYYRSSDYYGWLSPEYHSGLIVGDEQE